MKSSRHIARQISVISTVRPSPWAGLFPVLAICMLSLAAVSVTVYAATRTDAEVDPVTGFTPSEQSAFEAGQQAARDQLDGSISAAYDQGRLDQAAADARGKP